MRTICLLVLVSCAPPPEPEEEPQPTPQAHVICGDQKIDKGELCDGSNVGMHSCKELGFGKGKLACKGDCKTFDVRGCGAPETCGDGEITEPEVCDGLALAGFTCSALGLGSGDLACRDNCSGFDTSACGQAMMPSAPTGPIAPSAPTGPVTSSSAPTISSLLANAATVSQYTPTVFTAVVTDPDGDITSGELLDPVSGKTYGAFVATTTGEYTLSADWNAIANVRAATTYDAAETRTFRARFIDEAGHSATKDVSVKIACTSSDEVLCGSCTRVKDACKPTITAYCSAYRANCGACGNVCGDGEICVDDQCVSGDLTVRSNDNADRCDSLCPWVNRTCAEAEATWTVKACGAPCSATCGPGDVCQDGVCASSTQVRPVSCTGVPSYTLPGYCGDSTYKSERTQIACHCIIP